jgi:S-DNA-T family DNA segregation ATPase FtsK/SpoIIIE
VHTLNSIRLEIDARNNLLQDAHARNIVEYNEKFVNRKLDPGRGHSYRPRILVIIDEIMPLLQNASDFNLNDYFNKILALAHIVGVHFVVSSKYADSNTLSILGRLFATRIVFQTNKNLSREIVGNDDSVNLLPCGDALCFMNGSAVRFQPTLLDCDKGYDMVKQIANQRGYPTPYYLPDDNCNEESDSEINVGILDPLLEDVARLIIRQQFPSTSFVQRKFGLGYNRAARLMDQLEKIGVVGPIKGAMPREFLVVDEVELENKLQHIYSNSCKR